MTPEQMVFRDSRTGRTVRLADVKRVRPSRDLSGARTVTIIPMGGESPIRFAADWSEKACGLISAAALAIRRDPKPAEAKSSEPA